MIISQPLLQARIEPAPPVHVPPEPAPVGIALAQSSAVEDAAISVVSCLGGCFGMQGSFVRDPSGAMSMTPMPLLTDLAQACADGSANPVTILTDATDFVIGQAGIPWLQTAWNAGQTGYAFVRLCSAVREEIRGAAAHGAAG